MKKRPFGSMKLHKKMNKIKQAEELGIVKQHSSSRFLRKMLNSKLTVIGLGIFAVIILACIFAPLISRYDPLKIDLRNMLQSPSFEHIFGTDKLGRDIFARILFGGRISILIGFGSAIGAAVIGILLGTYSGYKGGWLDSMLVKVSEVFMSFPQIILVMLLVSMLGQSIFNLVIIFILTGWSSVFRLVRARMLSIREEEYVQALKAFGLSNILICYKHMLPNATGAIAVNITLTTAVFILQEAALSFLGLGVPLQIPTWGNIINVANDMSILKNNWWVWLPVGIFIALFVLSINLIGDGLRDSTDPTQQG